MHTFVDSKWGGDFLASNLASSCSFYSYTLVKEHGGTRRAKGIPVTHILLGGGGGGGQSPALYFAPVL